MPRFASRLVPPLFGKGYHHSPSLPREISTRERNTDSLSLERKKNSRETGDEKERKREREKKKGGEEKREIPTKDR